MRVPWNSRLGLRVSGGVLVLLGLIAAVIGTVLTISQSWPKATGTVSSCHRYTTTSYSNHHLTTHHHNDCTVSWGQNHSTSMDLSSDEVDGDSVALRVHGDTAIEATPAAVAYGVLALGIVLVVAGIMVAFVVARRRPARRAPIPFTTG